MQPRRLGSSRVCTLDSSALLIVEHPERVVIHLPIDLISEELVAKMRDRNVRIHAADVNLKHEIARAYELGVDQLSTDRLADALALRPPAGETGARPT